MSEILLWFSNLPSPSNGCIKKKATGKEKNSVEFFAAEVNDSFSETPKKKFFPLTWDLIIYGLGIQLFHHA